MANSKFWQVMAISLVTGIFYTGHALQTGGDFSLPSLANEARANGVTAVNYSGNRNLVITASPDGRQIYVWDTAAYLSGSDIDYVGTYIAEE